MDSYALSERLRNAVPEPGATASMEIKECGEWVSS